MVDISDGKLTVVSESPCDYEDAYQRVQALINILQLANEETMDAETRYFMLEILRDYQLNEHQWKLLITKAL